MGRPDTWSKEQLVYLKNNYECGSWTDLELHCCRNKSQIREKAHKIGLSRKSTEFSLFTDAEIDLIRLYWSGMADEEFVKKYMPYRTPRSVQVKASKLGLYKNCAKWSKMPYTEEEDNFILKHYTTMSVKELTENLMGRTKASVHNRMLYLGATDCNAFLFSDNDDKFIKDHLQEMTDEEIGRCIHRTARSIKWRREKLGLLRVDPNAITHYPDLEEYLHKNNTSWRGRAMKNWNYRCAVTGERMDVVHHLVSNNTILKVFYEETNLPDDFDINLCDKEQKEIILNKYLEIEGRFPDGVCLSSKIHKLFHGKYGYGNNTSEQFIEFVRSIAPDRVCKILNNNFNQLGLAL